MFKVRSTNNPELIQDDRFSPKTNIISLFPKNETQQKEHCFFQDVTWKIRTYKIPQKKHVLLHLLIDTTSHTIIAACISEMYCVLPTNERNVKTISKIVRLGDIKIQKRIVRVVFDKDDLKQEFMGVLLLAQIMVSFKVIGRLNKSQISEALKTLEEKRRFFTDVLKASECQIKRLTRKEQLHYMEEGEINVNDVILFENSKDLLSFLPKQSNASESTMQTLFTQTSENVPNIFQRFFYLPSERTSSIDKEQKNCKEVI